MGVLRPAKDDLAAASTTATDDLQREMAYRFAGCAKQTVRFSNHSLFRSSETVGSSLSDGPAWPGVDESVRPDRECHHGSRRPPLRFELNRDPALTLEPTPCLRLGAWVMPVFDTKEPTVLCTVREKKSFLAKKKDRPTSPSKHEAANFSYGVLALLYILLY